jgi:hypothetical protein
MSDQRSSRNLYRRRSADCCDKIVLRFGTRHFAAGSDQDLPGIAKPAISTHENDVVALDTGIPGVGTASVVIRGPAADLSVYLLR